VEAVQSGWIKHHNLGDLIFSTLIAPVEVASYNWVTTNDAPAHDADIMVDIRRKQRRRNMAGIDNTHAGESLSALEGWYT
jgi:hypothetical protein